MLFSHFSWIGFFELFRLAFENWDWQQQQLYIIIFLYYYADKGYNFRVLLLGCIMCAAKNRYTGLAACAGVLFSKSIRSRGAKFTLMPHSVGQSSSLVEDAADRKDNRRPFIVRLEFQQQEHSNNIQEIRSYCRRKYKLGDYLEFNYNDVYRCWWRQRKIQQKGETEYVTGDANIISDDDDDDDDKVSDTISPIFVFNVSSMNDTNNVIRVKSPQVWNLKECQKHQNRYIFGDPKQSSHEKKKNTQQPQKETNLNSTQTNNTDDGGHHGGTKDKRLKAGHVVNFFLRVLEDNLHKGNEIHDDQSQQQHQHQQQQQQQQQQQRVRDYLNKGSGVVDVAGGSGHVSLAFALAGVQSTVIDSRPTAGLLPSRDRKFWKNRLKQQQQQQQSTNLIPDFEYCQPASTIVPFKVHRAWFGSKIVGVDTSFRHPDEEDIPIIGADDNDKEIGDSGPLSPLHDASAIVALHPDEATAAIVQYAVKHRIPFVIVPCCVFARLFPHRCKKDGQFVSTYDELLDWIQEQHPSIQRTELPFEGRNVALWSTFS
jgi:hypothetical protein